MSATLISGGTIINEGRRFRGYILIENGLIAEIGEGEYVGGFGGTHIDAAGKTVIPGVIDAHVHFREPGLIHKGDMASESAAAVAGGVTTVLEMPNTNPATTTREALEAKFEIAEGRMHTNYSFFFGADNSNLAQIKRLDPRHVCGVKLFMGSSTGNILVDNDYAISALFAESPVAIAAHCEDENIIRTNTDLYRRREAENATAQIHPLVRSEEACLRSSARAVELAARYGSRLHIAHLTTARELALFDAKPTASKKITAEACIPHLWFTDADYARSGNLIKCNPAIKTASDRDGLRTALTTGRIDSVATDHAPHTREEKSRGYWDAPAGIPMVQHSLAVMTEFAEEGITTLETVVEKMCHAPALIYGITGRGFLRKGYRADIVIVNSGSPWRVSGGNILYKCGWSPLEGHEFRSRVEYTIINGRTAYANGELSPETRGERLTFGR